MTQLSFSIRTTASCKTVHLVGSWDGYGGQLPLAQHAAKKDAWAGTFRFNGSAIREGERYWYYYVIDGYHVAHDPACDSTVEPKTGRRLNLLVVKAVKHSSTGGGHPRKASGSAGKGGSGGGMSSFTARRHARHHSIDVPRGRPVSPSQIKEPRPVKPPGVASPRAASTVSAAEVSEHGSTTVAHLATQLDKKARLGDEQQDWDEWGGGAASALSLSSSSCSSSDSGDYSYTESDVDDDDSEAVSWASSPSPASDRRQVALQQARRNTSRGSSSAVSSTSGLSSTAASINSSSRGSPASSRTSAASSSVSGGVLRATECGCARVSANDRGGDKYAVRVDCGGLRCGGRSPPGAMAGKGKGRFVKTVPQRGPATPLYAGDSGDELCADSD